MTDFIDQGFASQTVKMEWLGHQSCKFPQNERKHYASQDMLNTIEAVEIPFLGRKHYVPAYGAPRKEKPCLRAFPDIHNKESTIQEDKILRKTTFEPTKKPYGHKEKLHLYQDPSKEREYMSTIRTFSSSGKNSHEAYVEGTMGRKKRIEYMDEQRNLLDIRSLGDKIYKHPEYSTGFYKDGGLVPGSTLKLRMKKDKNAKKPEQTTNKLKGTTWKEKVKKDEKDEEEKAVLSLAEWEKTTLKEANPKWRDPDEVELEAPKEVKIEQKNAKKPAKK